MSAKPERPAEQPSQPKKKQSKYRNEKQEVEGWKFDSKKEAARFQALRLREKAGDIKDLRMQVGYPMVINGVKVCSYVADFVYFNKDGAEVVEDVKSVITRKNPVYRIKLKLMLALFGITISEV